MGPAPDDWRRMGQEDRLAGLAFTWKDYEAYSARWDHDHCEFCFKKLVEPGVESPDVGAGDTPSERYWVCRECFDDFRPEFGWEVVDSDPDAASRGA